MVSRFCSVVGLPKLVLVDDGSEFKDLIIKTCSVLMMRWHPVTKGNHKAILSERFHRCLNKVEWIHAANCETVDEWIKGVHFAVCAWNAGPIDGTNVSRSYAAMGRKFPFPADVRLDSNPAVGASAPGQASLEYMEAAFPLLRKQQKVLKALVDDRREHHREMQNSTKQGGTSFAVRDLVITWVEVQTNKKKGPGKLQLKARGPCRVSEQLLPNTYWIQRIPFKRHINGSPYKPHKKTAAQMEKLPLRLVIHKHTDGTDANWAALMTPFLVAPLQHVFGAPDHGTYQQTQDKPWAFECIEDVWQDDLPEVVDDDYVDDHSHLVEPSPKPAIKKV